MKDYTPAELVERGSVKWTTFPGTLGAFIAESDFGTAPCVHAALEELSAKELFTYAPPAMHAAARQATAEFHARRYGWQIEPENIDFAPDVLSALLVMLDLFSPPEAPVVLLTPAYMPFFIAPATRDRTIREVPLIRTADSWEIDAEALDAALEPGAVFIHCNPHNPIGKVYTRAEHEQIAALVEKNGARVFSDEIHAPLVFDGAVHIPYATVSEAAARHTLTATSGSKAFNTPGLKCAQVLLTNPADREVYRDRARFVAGAAANPGLVAATAAYREGDAWLAEFIEVLDANRKLMGELVAEHLPQAAYLMPQGTYIAWLDLRAYDLGEDAAAYLREHAEVALTNGQDCGQVGAGSVRINMATPAAILTEIVERIARACAAR
ncbi:MalY/PatB family protein [Brevibacterium otitidis]|uniref:cysteine-S-conjugate beta-lyase n=1 Tax=Brevibacterium otitidis TaxID=53364 RepID=A0ABV5X5X6_9MICO|nr:aminotransferase class I/II-fold pyridoxal phosphate-dependent enzyme [Brevibacterium otitidis]